PDADIPVLQLSINALRPLDYHLDLAASLAPLRERGVMILASGNVVHNLRAVVWNRPDMGFDWSHRFDDAESRSWPTSRAKCCGSRSIRTTTRLCPRPITSFRYFTWPALPRLQGNQQNPWCAAMRSGRSR